MICDLPRWRHCVTSRRYCHATVMLLSCYCHATVMLLSCCCHATVMLLSALSPGLLDIFVQRRVTGKTGEVIHLQRLGSRVPRGISDFFKNYNIYNNNKNNNNIYIYITIPDFASLIFGLDSQQRAGLNQIWLHLCVKHNINAQQLETPHQQSSKTSNMMLCFG